MQLTKNQHTMENIVRDWKQVQAISFKKSIDGKKNAFYIEYLI